MREVVLVVPSRLGIAMAREISKAYGGCTAQYCIGMRMDAKDELVEEPVCRLYTAVSDATLGRTLVLWFKMKLRAAGEHYAYWVDTSGNAIVEELNV